MEDTVTAVGKTFHLGKEATVESALGVVEASKHTAKAGEKGGGVQHGGAGQGKGSGSPLQEAVG
jgi:hypothetical protein